MDAPETLQNAIIYFSDADRCFQYALNLRWPDGLVTCPRCNCAEHSFIKTRRIWFCKGCKKQFTLKVGTIFEDSPLGLDKWMCAFWMICNCKNGVSSCEVARSLGITQKSAWFMLHRIRKAMKQPNDGKFSGGPVEVDESFHGGEPKNRHMSKRQNDKWITGEFGDTWKNPDHKSKAGRGSDKVPVVGMLDRSTREVRAHVVPTIRRDLLMDAIL
jgi:transposase-like protein